MYKRETRPMQYMETEVPAKLASLRAWIQAFFVLFLEFMVSVVSIRRASHLAMGAF
jgi:hypothetical protein